MPREPQTSPSSPPPTPIASLTIPIRVRYPEADPMGYLHHSVYLQYFEMGRVELLRSLGHSYAELEAAGVFFVVTKVEVKYRAPARFDDELTLHVHLVREGPVRLDHAYELKKGEQLLAEGHTIIACIGRDGHRAQCRTNCGRSGHEETVFNASWHGFSTRVFALETRDIHGLQTRATKANPATTGP